MEKWEYKIISSSVGQNGLINPKIYLKEEPILNELGNNGWELVGIAPFTMGGVLLIVEHISLF